MVEDFKQWQVENKTKNEKRSAYLGAFWSLVVALYFILSFLTMAWYITWIIFLIAAAVEQIIKVSARK